MLRPNYNKYFFLFRNRRVTRQIDQLDPLRDHKEMVRLMGAYEFPFDVTRALELALFRTFASPSISKLLDHTGEFERRGQKRYDDTAILVSEFLYDGYDGPVGSRAIAQMNLLHGKFAIPNEDFLFVLSTFVFEPIHWMQQFGWRPFSAKEQTAVFIFWRHVAEKMGLSNLPDSIDEFRLWAENYQQTHFVFAESNQRVANATVRIVQGWLPTGLKWAALPTINALIDDRMRRAFGYPPPHPLWTALVKGALWIRKMTLKVVTFEPTPQTPRSTFHRTYPTNDYVIEQIGPEKLLKP